MSKFLPLFFTIRSEFGIDACITKKKETLWGKHSTKKVSTDTKRCFKSKGFYSYVQVPFDGCA